MITFKHIEQTIIELIQGWSKAHSSAVWNLAQYGWFTDLVEPLGQSILLNLRLKSGDTSYADETLTKYYTDNLYQIEKRLTASFPKRAQILREAFQAHRLQMYSVSIPAFLCQSDGICNDLFGQNFFTSIKGQKSPRVAPIMFEKDTSGIMRFIGRSISERTHLNKNQWELAKSTGLNRHQIIHGIDTTYGTEINSFKAISFINFLCQMCTLIQISSEVPNVSGKYGSFAEQMILFLSILTRTGQVSTEHNSNTSSHIPPLNQR